MCCMIKPYSSFLLLVLLSRGVLGLPVISLNFSSCGLVRHILKQSWSLIRLSDLWGSNTQPCPCRPLGVETSIKLPAKLVLAATTNVLRLGENTGARLISRWNNSIHKKARLTIPLLGVWRRNSKIFAKNKLSSGMCVSYPFKLWSRPSIL
jgi:hypothetical protein